MRYRFVLFTAALLSGAASVAHAQNASVDAVGATKGPGVPAASAADRRVQALAAPVRGLYAEARMGGGYSVIDDTIDEDAGYPTIAGHSEALGGAAGMQLVLGYDVADMLAFEVLAGVTMVSGRRIDRVRDVAMLFSGAGVRLSFPVAERLYALASLAAGYVRSSTGVEAARAGFRGSVGAGVEYFVHVRHFSIGVDITAMAAATPMRAVVALMPRIKYTF